jgi:Lrp/AsnC family transcriptional regulator for asnA, asnC and gidA
MAPGLDVVFNQGYGNYQQRKTSILTDTCINSLIMYNICSIRKQYYTYMVKIDAIDRQISDLLIEDGRMTCSMIARRIGGVSERAVRYRINRLTKNQILAVHGNVNAPGLGFNVFADVFIDVEPGMVKEIARLLSGYESVSYVACTTGDTDISIQVFARDNNELYQFVTEVIGKIPGVRKSRTSIISAILKDDHVWHIPTSCIQEGKTTRA